MEKLVIITGPTAAGKTQLSLQLAKKLDGEIISADSMQVYQGMDIGTAKPKEEDRKRVPHHLIDIVDPREDYSVGRFRKDASRIIKKLADREKLPILVGGTGLYIKALLENYPLSQVSKNEPLRQSLHKIAQEKGSSHLHNLLKQVDQPLAEKLHPNDLRRIIRGLEVYHATGTPLSQLHKIKKDQNQRYQTSGFVLSRDRDNLYARIDQRVEDMFESGLIQEVEELLRIGCTLKHTSMQGLGYKEAYLYLKGFSTPHGIKHNIKKKTRRYAKKQLTWFRHQLNFPWVNLDEGYDKTLKIIYNQISNQLNLH